MKKEYYLIVSTFLVSTSLYASNPVVQNDENFDKAIALSYQDFDLNEKEDAEFVLGLKQSMEEEEFALALALSVEEKQPFIANNREIKDDDLEQAIKISLAEERYREIKEKNRVGALSLLEAKQNELRQALAGALNNLQPVVITNNQDVISNNQALVEEDDDLKQAIALSLDNDLDKPINEMMQLFKELRKEYKQDLLQVEATLYPNKDDQLLHDLDSIDAIQEEDPFRAAQAISRLEEIEKCAPKYSVKSPSDEEYVIVRFMKQYGYSETVANAAYEKFVNGVL